MSASVVIPAYNAERFLTAAVQSAVRQVPAPLEIIVVNDGSDDATGDVARSIPGVTYLWSPRRGQAHARNLGVSASRGDVVSFLDADDLWMPGKMEYQMGALSSDPGLSMVFGLAAQFADPDGPLGRPVPSRLPGTMAIRRSSWDRIPPMSDRWRVGEFVDWYARAVESGMRDRVVQKLVLLRRLHGSNLGSGGFAREDYAKILKESLDRRRARR